MSTVEKAVDLLFLLREQSGPVALTRLQEDSGLPKASVHRLLRSLMQRQLVEQDELGRYGLGAGLLALGLSAFGSEVLSRSCQGVLREHAARLGETLFLVIARAGELVVAAKAEGTGFLRAAPQVGTHLPAHATAVGRLFLAHSPEQVQQPQKWERFTKATPVGPLLEQAVQQTKRRGYAVSRDEWQPGLAAVAAPVQVGGQMLGAVALACATSRLDQLGERNVVEAVRRAASDAGSRQSSRTKQAIARRSKNEVRK